MNAETGEQLWDKQLDGLGVSLEYKDGVLFVVNSTTIDALNAKNAEMLWSYPDICWEWGDSLIFGNTLFVITHDNNWYEADRYVVAIDTEAGTLKWEYELNITSFDTGGRSYYYMSDPLVNGDIFVSKYHASYSSYDEPIAIDPDETEPYVKEPDEGTIINPDEAEPDIEVPEVEEGLVALDAHTGEEVWRYPNL